MMMAVTPVEAAKDGVFVRSSPAYATEPFLRAYDDSWGPKLGGLTEVGLEFLCGGIICCRDGRVPPGEEEVEPVTLERLLADDDDDDQYGPQARFIEEVRVRTQPTAEKERPKSLPSALRKTYPGTDRPMPKKCVCSSARRPSDRSQVGLVVVAAGRRLGPPTSFALGDSGPKKNGMTRLSRRGDPRAGAGGSRTAAPSLAAACEQVQGLSSAEAPDAAQGRPRAQTQGGANPKIRQAILPHLHRQIDSPTRISTSVPSRASSTKSFVHNASPACIITVAIVKEPICFKLGRDQPPRGDHQMRHDFADVTASDSRTYSQSVSPLPVLLIRSCVESAQF